jgi:hypothetical protein
MGRVAGHLIRSDVNKDRLVSIVFVIIQANAKPRNQNKINLTSFNGEQILSGSCSMKVSYMMIPADSSSAARKLDRLARSVPKMRKRLANPAAAEPDR